MSRSASFSRAPDRRLPCPICGPNCKHASNRTRPVRAEWSNPDGSVSWYCNRCEDKGRSTAGRLIASADILSKVKKSNNKNNQAIAQRLWERSIAIVGTPAESYLVQGRGISARLPSTLRYLSAYKDFPHALIAACSLAVEAEPGVLEPPETVPAIHFTELSENGQTKLNKRMLGPVSGHPICVAPPNDNLGLVITEGIEEALSVHQATGLGAWAAGSASHVAKLARAVPEYVQCVTLMQDADPAGAKACDAATVKLLRRGFEVRVVRLEELSHAA